MAVVVIIGIENVARESQTTGITARNIGVARFDRKGRDAPRFPHGTARFANLCARCIRFFSNSRRGFPE